MKKTYDLVIMNQKFTIKSEADEKHVKKVADYVNKKMHDIKGADRVVSSLHVAILAALNIADDFVSYKKNTVERTENWMERLKGILNKIS